MKGESDVVAHVVAATGIGEAEVRRVVEAAFGFLRASALAGEEVAHPSLGTIRPRQRESDGKTVFRFLPGGSEGGGREGRAEAARPAAAASGLAAVPAGGAARDGPAESAAPDGRRAPRLRRGGFAAIRPRSGD